MKRYLIIPFIFIALLFTGCLNDGEEVTPEYAEFGVVKNNTSSNFIIRTDSKAIMKVTDGINQNINIAVGTRVYVRYSPIQTFVDESYNFTAKVIYMSDVEVDPILNVTSEVIRDTLANETATIINAWIAQDFLNINFRYYMDNNSYTNNKKTNFFYVSKDPLNQFASGTPIVLNFHHNNKLEHQRLVEGFISVPIRELRKERENSDLVDSVMINLIGKDQSSMYFSEVLKYKYEHAD